MATITIRNLDDSVKQRLRIQAASHNRSMKEEVRLILQNAVRKIASGNKIGSRIHRRFKEAGGRFRCRMRKSPQFAAPRIVSWQPETQKISKLPT